jgi:hypothetical protein
MQANLDTTVAGAIYLKSITLPDTVAVIRAYSDKAIRVAVSETPVAINTATFVIGSILNASEWVTFAVCPCLTRTLQMTCASTANVTLEIY